MQCEGEGDRIPHLHDAAIGAHLERVAPPYRAGKALRPIRGRNRRNFDAARSVDGLDLAHMGHAPAAEEVSLPARRLVGHETRP